MRIWIVEEYKRTVGSIMEHAYPYAAFAQHAQATDLARSLNEQGLSTCYTVTSVTLYGEGAHKELYQHTPRKLGE
jgi:hypothetical protein